MPILMRAARFILVMLLPFVPTVPLFTNVKFVMWPAPLIVWPTSLTSVSLPVTPCIRLPELSLSDNSPTPGLKAWMKNVLPAPLNERIPPAAAVPTFQAPLF